MMRKCPLWHCQVDEKHAVVRRPQQMSTDPEEIQDESVYREKPLRMHGGFEPAHLSLALSRWLM